MARGRRMGGYHWPPSMHQVLRLCIKSSPGHVKYTINKKTQNARSAAPVHTKWSAVAEWVDIVGHPDCTMYCACVSKVAQGTLITQITKTNNMHEALRLCIQIARGHRMGGCRWPPRMHQVLRLCIKSSPGHVNYTVDKNTQNARSAAPVHTKWPSVGEWSDNRGQPRMHQVLRLCSKNAPRHDKSSVDK